MSTSTFTTPLLLIFVASLSFSQACNPNPNGTATVTNMESRVHQVANASLLTNTTSKPQSQEQNVTEANSVIADEPGPNCHPDNDEYKNSSIPSYQHIVVSGVPFQRGHSHGAQAKDKILRMIAHYKASSAMPSWNDCVNFVQTNYLKALQQYYPNGLEEMKGIAEGAGVNLEDILILNSRYELTRWKRYQLLQNASPDKKAKSSSESPECIEQNSFSSSNVTEASNDGVKRDSPQDASNNEMQLGETDECTGAVALSSSTKYAHVLLGQNWDTSEFILNNDTAILLEVHPDPCEHIKSFVMLTEAGQLGRSGMNADGLGIVGMSLFSSADVFQTTNERGWIPLTLLRRMFLESPNFSIGLRSILRTPVHVSGNMIIATAEDEALNVELTPVGYFTSQVPLEKEFFTHSNHFKSLSFLTRNDVREGSRGTSSLFRDRRVEKHLLNAWPRITEESFQTAFKDHVGYPNSVCEHSVTEEKAWTSSSPKETTVASIIFNLNQRTLQLSTGPPCLGSYKNYCFEFSQL